MATGGLSRVRANSPVAKRTWLLGEIEAQAKQCAPFNQRAFQARLRHMRGLTNQPPEVFEPALDALVECGVVVSLIKEIAGAGVSGATRWLGKTKAHIQLSLRQSAGNGRGLLRGSRTAGHS